MKKLTTIFVMLFLFVSVAFPQQQWTKNNSIAEGSYVSASFKNTDTGLFATKSGDVFGTVNGGDSFSVITPLPKNSINAVCINGANIWAVGGSKTLRSTNWGIDWINFAMFNPISMNNITDVKSVGDSTWFVGTDTAYSHVVRLTHVDNTYGWRSSQFPLGTPVQKASYLLGRIWAYGANDTIYSSTVNEPWTKNQIDNTVLCVVSMFADTNNTLFALTQNSDNSGLYKSFDTGKTWSKTSVVGKVYAGTLTRDQIFISVLDGMPKILSWANNSWQNSFQPDSLIVNFTSIQNNVWAVGASGVYQYKPRAINHPPILQNPGLNITMTANKTRRDTLVATDEDGDVVKYHQYLSNLGWVTTDSLTGVRVFSPTINDTGRHLVLFQAYDGYGGTDQVLDTIQVYLNRPPVITSSSSTDTLQLNDTYQDTLYYSDLDDDICTWTVPEKPSSLIASVNNQTLQLYWVANTVGTFNVRVILDDNHGGTDNWIKTLVVIQTNRAPVIDTSYLPRTARVGQDYSGYMPWSDPDNDRVFFTLTTAPSWLSITDSGKLFNNRSLYQSDVGNQLVTIHYTDNHGASGNFSYWLTVGIFYPPVLDDVTDSLAIPGQLYQTQPRLISMGNGKIQWYFIYNDDHPNFLSIDINTGLISGTPNTQNVGRYLVILQVVDSLNLTDQVQYWLRVPSPNGIGDGNGTPTEFALHQNYPNPFNPTTAISFSLPISSIVKLAVYNNLGQEVATLVDEVKEMGNYTVSWNPEGLPSGSYTYRLITEGFIETKKMLLIR